MFFYIVFTIMVLGTTALFKIYAHNRKGYVERAYIIFMGVIFSFFMGVRSFEVGKDTVAYQRIFFSLGSIPLNRELPLSISGYPIYRLLCKFVYVVLGREYRYFLLVTAIITITGLLYFIKKYSSDVFFSVPLFLLYYMYFNSWNASRQYLAIAFSLIAVALADRKKMGLSALFMMFAIFTHNTIAIMLSFYVAYFMKWNKRRIALILIAMIAVFSFSDIIVVMLQFFPRYQTLYLQAFLSGNMKLFGGTAQGRKAIVSLLFFVVSILCYCFRREKINTKMEWVILLFTSIELFIGIFFRSNSMILRLQMYFSPYLVVYIANAIEETKFSNSNKTCIKITILAVMLIPYFIQISENFSGINPYSWFNV